MYIEHLRIPVGPGTLHVERVGRGGPAVLLVHGFGTGAFLWRAIAPALAEAGFTAIAVDLLGFGESERPGGAAIGPAAQAEYLERALTALRLDEVQAVGQDLGALVALLLAAQHPRRLRRLVLLEPLDPEDLPGPAIRALQRASARAALGANSLFSAMPLLAPFLAGSVTAPVRMPDRLVARYLAPFAGADGMNDLLQAASAVTVDEDDRRRLAQVEGDILLWSGVLDGEPVDAPEAYWQQLLPRATVTSVSVEAPRGTLVAEEAPEALRAALQHWLAYP